MVTRNQRLGKECEKKFEELLNKKCDFVLPTHKGADFLCLTKGKISLWEIKYGTSNLTPFQRIVKKTSERLSIDYNVGRCACKIK